MLGARALGLALLMALFGTLLGAEAPMEAEPPAGGVRFEALDVFVDSGAKPLAAWQFELAAERGDVKIVGLEGGEHAAYREPPYYDPAALQNHRIIVAAFNTGRDLPAGRTRVARIHVQVTGPEPEYAIRLAAAASPDGERIPATVTLAKGEAK